jgi:spore coat polysaccharide biosynthesis predicted glycosyltransferase SpsG
LEKVDLMICGAGTTVWEACCVGTPFIALKMVDNQEENFNTLRTHQAAKLVDDEDNFEHLRNLFTDMQNLDVRREYSVRARSLVDGQGAARAIDTMIEMRGRA